MLTVEQKNANEIRFIGLISRLNIDLTDLSMFLDEIDFFNAPATTQYIGAYPGGLCEYALKVAYELGVLCNAYFPGRYSEEDIIKVALFKDIYKATMYESYLKNVKDETTGQWNTFPAYKTREANARPVFGDAALSSYLQAKKYIDFTDEQALAIIHSNGNYPPDIHEVMRNYPLVTLIRMADMAAAYISQ